MAEEEEGPEEAGRTVHVRLGTRSFARPDLTEPAGPERSPSGRLVRPDRSASGSFARPTADRSASGSFARPDRTASGSFTRPVRRPGQRTTEPTALDGASWVVLAACGATMVVGLLAAGRAVLAPDPPRASPPAAREGAPLRFDYQGTGPSGGPSGPVEEDGGPPAIYYEGPVIKDPDGRWYVARSIDDLGDRFLFDPRRVVRLVLKGEARRGQAAQFYVLFPGNILVKGHPELLTLIDLGIKQRSTYSLQTGRGAVAEQARPTPREEEEARTARRLERQRMTGEMYGIDYTDESEFAPPKPAPGAPPPRREWTDEHGVVRATAPPDPLPPVSGEPPRDQ